MKENFTLRTSLILGKENMEKLNKAHVLLIGVGGVGSFCAEALVVEPNLLILLINNSA